MRPIPAKASDLGREDEKEEVLPDSPQRPDSGPSGPESGRWGDGNRLLLNGLLVPWTLPKAGRGRAFGPKTKSLNAWGSMMAALHRHGRVTDPRPSQYHPVS